MEQVSMNLLQAGFAVALTVGVVEAIKRASGLASRYVPLVSLVVGIVAGGLLVGWTVSGAIAGLVVGLASCGLWSGVKATIGK